MKLTVTSKPRLLNLILLNLIVRWPTGAAIVRPPNTEYTQSIGACWEKLPKIVKITLLQFNYEFGHGNFSQYDLHNIFKIFTDAKKIVIDGNSHNKITNLRQVPCFRVFCLLSIQMKPFNHTSLTNKLSTKQNKEVCRFLKTSQTRVKKTPDKTSKYF